MSNAFVAIQKSISAQREQMRLARLANKGGRKSLAQFSTVIGHHPSLSKVGAGAAKAEAPNAEVKKPADAGKANGKKQGAGAAKAEAPKGKGGAK